MGRGGGEVKKHSLLAGFAVVEYRVIGMCMLPRSSYNLPSVHRSCLLQYVTRRSEDFAIIAHVTARVRPIVNKCINTCIYIHTMKACFPAYGGSFGAAKLINTV